MFLDRVIHFEDNLGDQVKVRLQKNLKSLIRVPYVVQLKVQVLSYNIILISSPLHVTSPSHPFRGKFGR